MVNLGSIVTIFEERVSQSPYACALKWSGGSWTYAELNARANRLAHFLVGAGVKLETPVGVFALRSPETLLAFLAVLKAGGAYVPLDPTYPADRIQYCLEDAEVPLVLADPAEISRLPATSSKVVPLDANLAVDQPETNPVCATGPHSLAHILYTSGSTGRPKGVLIEHRGIIRLTQDVDYVRITPQDVFLQYAALGFDISSFEIWGALLNGASVAVPPSGKGTLNDLASALRSFGITTTVMSAGLFHLLVEQELESLAGVRYLLTGGEVVSPTHAERFLQKYPRSHLLNAYGPTENSVFTTCQDIQLENPMPVRLSIGRPIKGGDVQILDDQLLPVKAGEIGELVLTGIGVARGYLNQPELTEQSFVQVTDPSGAKVRGYRSGDLGRFRDDGAIDFHGRKDDQVKINGIRIEPGEIKNILQSHPQVSAAEVLLMENAGQKRLEIIAVLRPGAHVEEQVLRDFLRNKVPGNWLPPQVRILPSLPLNSNGKVDRAALLAGLLQETESAGVSHKDEPGDPTEKTIWTIWRDLLPGVRINRDDHFADLGGDSLSALHMIARVEKTVGRTIGLKPLLEGGTIVDIANAARETGPAVPPPVMIGVQAGGARPPFFFAHGDYVCGGLYCQRIAHRLDPEQPFYALAPQGAFGEALPGTVEQVAANYVELIRSIQPKGPYSIGGFCNGAIVMYEVAQQLIAAGETVATLVLLDPPDLYFFILRRRLADLGGRFGLPQGKYLRLYQRAAEGIEIWRDHGLLRLLGDFRKRLARYALKKLKPQKAESVSSQPDLNFHYYEALAAYIPKGYPGVTSSWIIQRREDSDYCNKQMRYWTALMPKVRFEAVSGSHLELQNSIGEIAHIIDNALSQGAGVEVKESPIPV